MKADHDVAEDIYLEIYGVVAENANYLQPRSGVDFLLPEVLITSLTTTVFVAFFNGFFEELGAGFARLIKEKLFNRGKLREVEPQSLIQELAARIGQIKNDPERLQRAEQHIEEELRSLDMAPDVAKRMAGSTVSIIVKGVQDAKAT
jgi:hypothetical protein